MTTKYSRAPTTPKKEAATIASLHRMEIVIQGIADRTVSAVNDLVSELKTSGMNDDSIRARITQEIESGRTLSEMRAFATARCPGFLGDMTFRFARDTLADKQAAIDALRDVREKRQEAEDIIQNQDIEIAAYLDEAAPEPPPEANIEDEYFWVAVEDKNTCEVCSSNHGEVKTLAEWAEIGEPRSGACMGDQNCRCVLVPVSAMSEEDKKEIIDNGPINAENKPMEDNETEPKWHEMNSEERKEYFDPEAIREEGDYDIFDFDEQKFFKFADEGEEKEFREKYPYAALSSNPAGEEKEWFRFGSPPESNRSTNFAEQRGEEGVSVYATPNGSGGAVFFSGREVFSGPGRQVGWGSDGEPLIIPTGEWKPIKK